MQPTLDKTVQSSRARFSRVRFCRLSFPALALGLCALICLAQQAALGQAQVGSAETSFDEGPDKLPAIPNTPIPSVHAQLPVPTTQTLPAARRHGANPAAARSSHALGQNIGDAKIKNVVLPRKRQPEGTLTAAR